MQCQSHNYYSVTWSSKTQNNITSHCGHDPMVVGFTTTCSISAYHHCSCEFECHSWEVYSIQHYMYVIKFVSYLRQVSGFLRVLRSTPSIKLPSRYNSNIVESGVTPHKPHPNPN